MKTSIGSISVFQNVRTVSELNKPGPLRVKLKRKKEHRVVFCLMVKAVARLVSLPCTVRMVRCAKGRTLMDDDNLSASLKHCRDGVADGLGVDDSAKGGITWEYAQEIACPDWGVRVEIRWDTTGGRS